jgi:hypothetical protein
MRRVLSRAGVLVAAFALFAAPVAAIALNGGFAGPVFGIATAPNGDILVADVGAGIAEADGTVDIPLPGVTSIAPIGRSSMWVTRAGENPEANSGQALLRVSQGNQEQVVNLFEFEEANDPDGAGVDSNPYDVASLGGGAALVIDAGGNDLLHVDRQGNVEVVFVFPDEIVSTADIKGLAGCPLGPPFICGLPDMIPAQAVPTSVAVGPDGYAYVGELKGFPAPTNESNIWRCDDGGCTKAFDGGFTSIIDLTFGPDGLLYVAELDEQTWAAVEIFGSGVGGTINACNVDTLACDEVATGINQLTGITFGKDGTLYATQNALSAPELITVPLP